MSECKKKKKLYLWALVGVLIKWLPQFSVGLPYLIRRKTIWVQYGVWMGGNGQILVTALQLYFRGITTNICGKSDWILVLRVFTVQYKYIPTFRTNMLPPFLLFCTMSNKCTIISQIITLLHVSTLSCHPQGACNQYIAKLRKYLKCNCW